jgi:hypothetical protein
MFKAIVALFLAIGIVHGDPIEPRSVDGRKVGLGNLPELLFNREVTLSDAEQYFYKNIFTYLDTKFKLIDNKLVSLSQLNKTIDSLRADVTTAHTECLQSIKGVGEHPHNLQEMDLKKYRIFADYEIQSEFHSAFMLASMIFKNATPESYYTCLTQCERDDKCLITVIKPSECHLYSNELVTKHVKLAKSSNMFREDTDQVVTLAGDG